MGFWGIYHGVTLGGTSLYKGAKRHPTLGRDVVIGAGAKVLGGFEVGDGAKVGSNAVVTKPVPDYAVAIGNPARVRGYVCECCQPLAGSGRSLACRKCGLRYVKTRDGVRRATDDTTTKPKAKAATPAAKAAPGKPRR